MDDTNARPAMQGLVEQYVGGTLSRRQFVKGALALGFGMTTIGGILAACSGATNTTSGTPKKGGTLKEGYDLDFSRLDPINTNWYDPAFYAVYESLVTNDPQGNYVPQIASSWTVRNMRSRSSGLKARNRRTVLSLFIAMSLLASGLSVHVLRIEDNAIQALWV